MISGHSNEINLNSLANDLATNYGNLLGFDKPTTKQTNIEKTKLAVQPIVCFNFWLYKSCYL